MQRFTARLLLLAVLIGILAPVSLALSQESPHACCLRKQPHHHDSNELSFDSRHCGQDCCRPVLIKQWAQTRPPVVPGTAAPTREVTQQTAWPDHNFDLLSSKSVRAPPDSQLA
jgi:hypothetical protein